MSVSVSWNAGFTARVYVCVSGRCVTAERQRQLTAVTESLVEQLRLVEERRATVDRQSAELTAALDTLTADRQQLDADRRVFNNDRRAFAEEMVRINTVNKIHDR